MNTNFITVKLSHKSYHFIRTESRFFEISECTLDDNGVLSKAVLVPDSTVADLLAQASKHIPRGKASRIHKFRKEEAV